MLNKIIGFSIRNKLIIGLFTLALIGYGAYETTRLPIDAVPDITNNQVQVITIAPSFGATDIERLVTFPVEQANSNIHGLKEIRSFSRFGLSLVTIVFEDDIDIYWARQQVAERLQKVQTEIPPGIGVPELGPISTGLGEIYQYVVRPKAGYENKFDATELRTIQDWIVRRQLLGVEGVAEVSSFGGKLKQYEIAVNPQQLQAYGLSISDVFGALEKNNQNTGGAYIEKGPAVLFIRTEGLIKNKEDIENISVKSTQGGNPLFIRDVAQVNIGHATRYGALCYNDQGEVSGAVVMMLKGANSNQVIKKVKERVAQIQKTLPEGVIIEPFLDRTKMVENAIGTVEKNLLEGALIVVFILVLFLGNFRAGLLVASVIPLSMLFAIILMNQFGVSGNLMSLGALDFGLIVDGAVIIVEAVMHQLSHSKQFTRRDHLSQEEMDHQVNLSASKMMNSAVFGQVIILIVYLPIFTLHGIEGKMFKPMAQTVAFALLGAFILSLTYIPMMSAWVLSKKIKHEANLSDRIMAKIENAYQKAIFRILKFPKIVIGVVFGLFVSALLVLGTLGGEFIPALEEGDFAVETRVLTGSNLNTTIESTQKTAHILKTRFPEVEKVVTKIGSGEIPTDPMAMEASDMMVILKNKEEWTSAKTFDELAEKMTEALADVPGVTVGFQFPVQMRFNELMTGARQDVVCKIFGENLDTLAHYAQRLGKIVNTVEGSQNLFVEPVTGMEQIVIEFKQASIAQYNLNVVDINKIVNSAFAGQNTGLVFEGEKRFGLVVRLQDEGRKSLEDVQNLLIPTPQGTQIPLYQLADVAIKTGPNQIQREDAKRRIIIGFNIRNRDVQSIINELQQKVEAQIKLPSGYYVTYGGAFENLNEAKKRLMVAVPVSLALIFILLFFAFSSVRHGLLIYTAIPLSAVGGIFFLALRGMPFSISAGVGFIALFGVAVLNGIVLIAEFNRLKTSGLKNLHRIVITGTKLRLRPVMMTAFVASLGFLPMALSSGAGAEVQKPLATVVIGGLMIATFLTLFVLPVLYVIFEKTGKIKKSPKVVIAATILLSAMIPDLQAQQTISLEKSVETALKNNLEIKDKKLRASYQEKLIGSYKNIPATNVSLEAGRINSIYLDTRVGLSQSLSFPKVYASHKKWLEEEWKSALIGTSLKEAELKKWVNQAFYTLVVLKEKEKLLMKADSIYSVFLEKSRLRFDKGESNVLEKTTAEIQLGHIQLQLRNLRQEIELGRLHFKWLLNVDDVGDPETGSPKIKFEPQSGVLNEHPVLQLAEQQVRIAEANTGVEKSKLLPEITFGLNNMSIRGTGADNVIYSASQRFTSAQVAVGIPLFTRSQKSRINASKVGEMVAQNQIELQKKELETQYGNAWVQYQNRLQTLDYLEQSGLANALLIRRTAQEQLNGGEINYLDWVMLTNQSITLENNYLDAVQAFNESVISLRFFNSKH